MREASQRTGEARVEVAIFFAHLRHVVRGHAGLSTAGGGGIVFIQRAGFARLAERFAHHGFRLGKAALILKHFDQAVGRLFRVAVAFAENLAAHGQRLAVQRLGFNLVRDRGRQKLNRRRRLAMFAKKFPLHGQRVAEKLLAFGAFARNGAQQVAEVGHRVAGVGMFAEPRLLDL